MSGVNSKTELPPLLVSRSEFRFPLANVAEHTWIDSPPWAGIDNFGHISRMAQCNRVQRPPPPPHYIAQSKKTVVSTNNGMDTSGLGLQMDPVRRVKQLEKSLFFIKESHAVILQSLHREVDELKKRNRELQFQLVVGGGGSASLEDVEQLNEEVPLEAQKKIDKLEKEVRKLRSALREALKANANVNLQLEAAKRDYYLPKSIHGEYPIATDIAAPPAEATAEGNQRTQTPGGPSPKIEEYNDTLRQIQQASARTRSSKQAEGRKGEHRNNHDWGPSQMEHGRRYSDFQARLPRLPLRSQQNIQQQQQQMEMPYAPRNDMLPVLKKPLFPMLERGEKPRKPRGPQRPRFVGNLHQP